MVSQVQAIAPKPELLMKLLRQQIWGISFVHTICCKMIEND